MIGMKQLGLPFDSEIRILAVIQAETVEKNVDAFNQALNKYLAEYEKVGICPKHFESMTEYAEDYNKEISEEI